MDYELFIFSTYDAQEIGKTLVDLVRNVLKKDVVYKVIENEYIYIGCGLFGMNIEIEDVSDLEFIRNDCEIDVNLCISIQVSSREPDQGINELFKIIIEFMKYNKGNVLLLANGSEQVLRRDNQLLILNEEIDYIPYEEFDISYRKEKLRII
ncbi:hypothetical protein [Clostridium sp.]|uniref:hypothetical protein n=1 Tax=Clostridium sp. TaxID=1506 RepID=UPI00261E251B|nr:hypothetical protein [Clostridium sp.]